MSRENVRDDYDNDLEFICNEYLNYVFDEMFPDKDNVDWDNDIDWWRENFGFVATNDYDDGYDINEWFDNTFENEEMKNVFNCPDNIFDAIRYINDWYENRYGPESIMDWEKLSEDYLLRNYAYVYCEEVLENFIYEKKLEWDNEKNKIVEAVKEIAETKLVCDVSNNILEFVFKN